jgi:hypothetical protein
MPYRVISIFPDRRETRNFSDFDVAVTIWARACKQAQRAEMWHVDFMDQATLLGTFDEEGSSWKNAPLSKDRPTRYLAIRVRFAARVGQVFWRIVAIGRNVASLAGL